MKSYGNRPVPAGLRRILACLLLAAAGTASALTADVAVIGGGSAGFAAAWSAAHLAVARGISLRNVDAADVRRLMHDRIDGNP